MIIRPLIDFELPNFVAKADEILEAEIEAELERIRILNKTPVNYMLPRQIAKKMRKKELRKIDENLPAWFLNPLNEVDEQEEERLEAERLAAEKDLADKLALEEAVKCQKEAEAEL